MRHQDKVARVFAFTDLHGSIEALRQAVSNAMRKDCRFIICAGDLTNFGAGLSEMMMMLSKSMIPVFIVPGNHEMNNELDKECDKYGFINLHGQVVKYKGLTLAGLGGSSKTPFNTPNEYSEEEINELLDKFKDRENLILISHSPPHGYLDKVSAGIHAGSKSLLEFVKSEQPLMVICGHVHEHEGGQLMIGKTKIINPGPGSAINLTITP